MKMIMNPNASPNILRAYNFAKDAHSGQTRDFSGDDYFCHPFRVANTMYNLGFHETVVIAALLHDTIEDTDVDSDDIHKKFGSEVGILVDALTEPAKARGNQHSVPKYQRKAEFLKQLETAPTLAKAIKLADIIDNTNDFCKYYTMNTGRAERFYFAKMDMLTRMIGANPILYIRAEKSLDELRLLLIS